MSLELEQARDEIAALQRRLTEYAAEVERLRDSLYHTRQWWAVRFERMNDFAREELPEPLKERYFNIAANGVPSPADPPTYAVQMNELRHEIGRLREQGRECYVDADSKSTLNALEECRTERDKLKEGAKEMCESARNYLVGPDKDEFHPVTGLACGCCGKDIAEDGSGHEDRCPVGVALSKARELGLLEGK